MVRLELIGDLAAALWDGGRKSRRQTEERLWRPNGQNSAPMRCTVEVKGGNKGSASSSWPSDDKKLGKWLVTYFQQEKAEFEVIAIQLEIPRRQINM